MAIRTVDSGGLWIPRFPDANLGPPSSILVNLTAAGHKYANVIQVPKTGTIHKVNFWSAAVNGTGTMVVDCRLESLDTSVQPSRPSGSLIAAGANQTISLTGADDVVWKTTAAFTTPYAATVGDRLAVVMNITDMGTTTGLDLSTYSDTTGERMNNMQYSLLNNTGSWAVPAGRRAAAVTIEYLDGTYASIPGIIMGGWNAVSAHTYNTGTSLTRNGLRFRLPFPARLAYCWYWIANDGPHKIELYNDAGTLLNTLSTVFLANTRAVNTAQVNQATLSDQVDLLKDTWYRLVITPTSTTSITMYSNVMAGLEQMGINEGGQSFHRTHFTSSSWTDQTTGMPHMGIGLNGFDDGVFAGGIKGLHAINDGIIA
jgi:hypothetical protein